MSISVPLEELIAELGRRTRPAYVLTNSSDTGPHGTAAFLRWDGTHLVAGCGNTTARNVAASAFASVMVPPNEDDGYTLIVDADAAVAEEDGTRVLHLTPTHAVLHRPGVGPDGSDCGHDCQPLA